MFNQGDRVRLKNNPSVAGIVTDKSPEEKAGRIFYQVDVATGRKSFPENQLEHIRAAPDALADLKVGKLSSPADLRRALIHLRLTGKLADMIYSMGATNTDFHAYQFKPVLKLLNSPSRGLLIADEVGLGKTIEAGLVWTELVARFEFSRLLIVCPKSLTQKWREELRSKFSVDARICDAKELLNILRDNNERREGFAVIASLSGLRPPRGWNDEEEPVEGSRAELARYLADSDDDLFDLAIFDEAHHLRNTETTQHRLAQLVANVTDHLLFLSATPINLRTNDLRALLKLIDPDTFEREWLFEVLQEENTPLVKAWEALRDPRNPLADIAKLVSELPEGEILKTGARLKRLREEFDNGIADTPTNRVKVAARIEEMSLLGSIINRTRRRDVAEFMVERRPQTAQWQMSDIERSFYEAATQQIEAYAYAHDINERFLLAQTQRLLASSLPTAFRHWGERSGYLSLDDEGDTDEVKRMPGPLVAALGEICDDPATLYRLEANDTKLARLIGWLSDLRVQYPAERIIVFSSFRRTIDYLSKRLKAENFSVMELHGGIKIDRQDTIAQFAESAGGTILLTSEVGGEGLDLQFCRILINWDLPWNPMKVEQRIGRIDRIGQKSPSIDIINFIAEDTIEEHVYERLYKRLGIIKDTIGDFEPILGDIIRDIELILTNPDLTPAQRDLEFDRSVRAAEQRKIEAELLEREAPGLIAHGDSILQKIKDAQAPYKRVTPEDLRDYINGIIANTYSGSRIEPVAGIDFEAYDIRLSPQAQAEFSQYRSNHARRYPTRFSRDAANGVRVVFGRNPDPVRHRVIEAVPMTHPLARFCAGVVDARQSGITPRPATALQTKMQPQWKLTPGVYVLAVIRWSFEGLVPIDRLAVAGAMLDTGAILDEDVAEQVLFEALGASPALYYPSTDLIEKSINVAESCLFPFLEARRIDFEEMEAARLYDDVETQQALILQHKEREQRRVQALIRDLKLSGSPKRIQISYAIEAKLAKFLARMDLKLANIKKREADVNYDDPILVGMAIIDIQENHR